MASGTRTVEFFTEEKLVSTTDPLPQFQAWFKEAQACKTLHPLLDPAYATLSTCSKDAVPSSRIMVTFGHTEGKFNFFTNSDSHKGRDLAEDANATLLYYWVLPAKRQVRIQGKVQRLTEEESTKVFYLFPRKNQLSVLLSSSEKPSIDISSRAQLEAKYKELADKYADESVPIPVPPQWIGYVLVPSVIEFWQGYSDYLDDRFVFTKSESSGTWSVKRLTGME